MKTATPTSPPDLTSRLRFASPALHRRIAGIMGLVADAFGLPACALLERTRIQRVAEPRQIAMTLIREQSHLSLMDVGEIFDRDHGTVIHAIKAVRRRRETDASFHERIDEISRQVRRRF